MSNPLQQLADRQRLKADGFCGEKNHETLAVRAAIREFADQLDTALLQTEQERDALQIKVKDLQATLASMWRDPKCFYGDGEMK